MFLCYQASLFSVVAPAECLNCVIRKHGRYLKGYNSGEVVPGMALRLFKRTKEARYKDNLFEYLYLNGSRPDVEDAGVTICDSGIEIKHFLPDRESYELKNTHWYYGVVGKGNATRIGPNGVPESKLWKAYNPVRDQYRE